MQILLNFDTRFDLHIFGPDKETVYDIQIKEAVKLNGNH